MPPYSLSVRPAQLINPAGMIADGDTPLHAAAPGGSSEQYHHTYGLPSLAEGMYDPAVRLEAGVADPDMLRELTAPSRALMRKRHGGWWNIAFCDGHVEALRASQFFRREVPWQNARWNYDAQPRD